MTSPQMLSVPKARRGDRVAVLSPSFAAPGVAPAVHEQAMARIESELGLIPVEYPTTRQLGASPHDRAADLNAALADPTIRAILSTVGGEDQITVIPHLDAELARADPKPFLGYSDNTNILNWLWGHGVPGYYGGSTQVHLGTGPRVDEIHLTSLTAALLDGGTLVLSDPGESEDFGHDWSDPRALTEHGEWEPVESRTWAGPSRRVTGRTWGGCLEIIDWLALSDRMPGPEELAGAVLLVETSEDLPSAQWVGWWLRALGERGILDAVEGVLVARPPTSNFETRPDVETRARLRAEQRDVVVSTVEKYHSEAVVCVGVPFGHTQPQWVVPYGGFVTLDGGARTVSVDYR